MMRPSRMVTRTFAKARTSSAGSPSSTTTSAERPGARRPVRFARPKRAAGAVVSIAEDLRWREPGALQVHELLGGIVIDHVADVGPEEELPTQLCEGACLRHPVAEDELDKLGRKPLPLQLVRPELEGGDQRHAALLHHRG